MAKKQKNRFNNPENGHRKLFYVYEIIERETHNHYLVCRFSSELERNIWLHVGNVKSLKKPRSIPKLRNKVGFSDPMVKLAIKYEYWPIEVIKHHEGYYRLIRDASGRYTG